MHDMVTFVRPGLLTEGAHRLCQCASLEDPEKRTALQLKLDNTAQDICVQAV